MLGGNRKATNILVTSASSKIPLVNAMLTAAGAFNPESIVFAGDSNPKALANFASKNFLELPKSNSENLKKIIEILREHEIKIILPSSDKDVEFFSENLEKFETEGLAVIVSKAESVRDCIDKLTFSKKMSSEGLPVVESFSSLELCQSNKIVVKERLGSGSRNIGLNLDKGDAETMARNLTNPIFQGFIDGTEYSVDSWCDASGEPKGSVVRTRDLVINGESKVTTSVENSAIREISDRCLRTLNLFGPVVLQGIQTENEGFRIIEVNPRFGGASTCGIASGCNSLLWSLKSIENNNFTPDPSDIVFRSLKQVRVPLDIYI